jgi:hypothetical protein
MRNFLLGFLMGIRKGSDEWRVAMVGQGAPESLGGGLNWYTENRVRR